MPVLRRPPRRVWIWTAATLVLVVVATLLWHGSDAAATARSTASPAGEPTGSPAGELSAAWTRTATVLPQDAVAGGRVIVGDRHGITALDPATGERAWHYTRRNAVLCGLTTTEGVAVAVFRTAVRCDEAVALRADTGVYAWTRNVDFDSDVRLTSSGTTVLAVGRGSVVAVDALGDNIRWRFAPEGCVVVDATVGGAGIGVVLRCTGTTALRVRLIDAGQGAARWTRELPTDDSSRVALAGADAGVSLVVGDELQFLGAGDGSVTTTLPLPAAGAREPRPMSVATGPVVLVWARGLLVARGTDAGSVLWQQPALGLPVAERSLKVGSATQPLLAPEDGAFVARDPLTGTETGRFAAPGLAAGGVSTAVGRVVVYRLPGRVIGYR